MLFQPHDPKDVQNSDSVEAFYDWLFSTVNPYESNEQRLQEAIDTLERFIDRGDPGAIEFIRTLARSNPDVDEIDEARWLGLVHGVKTEVYEFMSLLFAKLLKEFSKP